MWASNPSSRSISLWVIGIGMAYGAFDELTQPLVNRFCEWNDWLADSVGICAAVLMIGLFRMLRRPRAMAAAENG
jgi:VanZ family protein